MEITCWKKLHKTSTCEQRAGCWVDKWPGVTTALQQRSLVYSFWSLFKLPCVVSYLWWVWPWSSVDLPSHCPHPSLCGTLCDSHQESCAHVPAPRLHVSKVEILHVLRPQSWNRALELTVLRERLVQLSLQDSVWWWVCGFLSSLHICLGESEHAVSLCKGRLPIIIHCVFTGIWGDIFPKQTLIFTGQVSVSSAHHLLRDVNCPDRLAGRGGSRSCGLKDLF